MRRSSNGECTTGPRGRPFGSFAIAGAIAIAAIARMGPANGQPMERLPGTATVETVNATALSGSKPPSFDIRFNALITSDYNYRGYTLSDHQRSVSGSFEATYGIFFAGVNAGSVDMPGLPSLQLTHSAGIRPVFGPVTVEVAVGYYNYPGSGGIVDYPEYYPALPG